MTLHNQFRWLLPILVAAFLLILLTMAFRQATLAQGAADVAPTPADAPLPEFADAEPLPGGCKTGLPPGRDEPVCCLSGVVEKEGKPVVGAMISIRDAFGEIGKVYTKPSPHPGDPPKYYIDLTKLNIRLPGQTRPITPTDVITLVASYSGVIGPKVRYEVQRGGQNLDFNPYDATVLPLQADNPGYAEPGKFQRIGDVTIDAQGNLYLWDIYNSRMQVLRLDGTGTWLNLPDWQREIGSQPHQVYAVNGLAVNNKTGHIYLADGSNNRIAAYTTDGDFTTKVISAAGGIASLDIDGGGNLYAYTYFEGIKKFNADGAVIARNTSAFLQWDTIGRNLAVSPQGDLFYIKDTTNTVVKFAPDLSTYITFTLQLTSGLPLTRPSAIMVDDTNTNTLFVFNNQKARLFAFDATNGQPLPNTWETLRISPGGGKFLASDQNHIYLISEYDGKIFQLSKDGGKPQRIWGGQVTNQGSIGMPVDIALAPDNSLWFADAWTGRLNRMVNNEIKQSWLMTELGQLASVPNALTFDRNGKLLLINSQGQLQRFRYENSTLLADTAPWGGLGSTLGKFCSPSSIDVDKNGYVYIAEYCNNRVQVLRQEPTTNSFTAITSLSALTATGSLSRALGIAVDDRVTPTLVYVGDGDHKRIVKLSFDGTALTYVDRFGDRARFYDVAQMALDEQGFLWVADQFYRVHRINPNQPTDWRIYGDWGDPTWYAYGVAITKTTTTPPQPLLYVSSRAWGLISSFTPMTESKPIATIVNLSTEDLQPGETLTAVGSGQDGDDTNEILLYEWTFINSAITPPTLTITSPRTQVTIPIVAGANQPGKLGPGLHTLRLRVLDNEQPPSWSEPVSRTIYVAPQAAETPATPIPTPNPTLPAPTPPTTCLAGGKWTMLLYLDADNSRDGERLLTEFRQSVDDLKQLNHPCVQIAAQIDGPPSSNIAISQTVRYLIKPDATIPFTGPLPSGEAQMDTAKDLSDFIQWGQRELPADRYYLAIADHGNAYQGIAFDHTSPNGEGWNAYLTVSELGAALSAPGVLPIDVLHLDACSMALLDVAYEVRNQVDYLIASQYIAWSYFAYADYGRYMTQQSAPKELAWLIVERYANLAATDGNPYTISALDLTRETGRIEPLKNAVDDLAVALKAWLNTDGVDQDRHNLLFNTIRNQSQFFDSNSNLVNTPRDAYVDLKHFAEQIQQVGLTNRADSLTQDILDAANNVLAELIRPDNVVWHEKHSTPPTLLPEHLRQEGTALRKQPIDLDNAHGVSIYYPAEGSDLLALPSDETLEMVAASSQLLNTSAALTYTQVYSNYIYNQLFTFSLATRWDEFLLAAYGEPPITATIATPPPPLAPVAPATPTGTPTPTPTVTPTPTATDMATSTPTSTPTPTPTAPVTPTTTPPVDPDLVLLQSQHQLHDSNGDGPSSGEIVQFNVVITNNSTTTMTNVVLAQIVQPPTDGATMAAGTPCETIVSAATCIDVGVIEAKRSNPTSFTVTLSSNAPIAPETILFVNHVRQPYTLVMPNQLYLPIVRK